MASVANFDIKEGLNNTGLLICKAKPPEYRKKQLEENPAFQSGQP